MGCSCKSIGCTKNLSNGVASFPKILRRNLSPCKGMVLTPFDETAFLQSTLKSSKCLDLDSIDDVDLGSPFPFTSKVIQDDYQVYKLYQIHIKQAVCRGTG